MKLKLTGLVVKEVKLPKRKFLCPNAADSTLATRTVTIFTTSITTAAIKAQASTINFTATTTTAITTKGIKAKNLWYIETIWINLKHTMPTLVVKWTHQKCFRNG